MTRSFARLVLLFALIACLFPRAAIGQQASSPAALHGRWNLVLQTPQGEFPTVVEFIDQGGGRVTASVLGASGSFSISDAAGTLDGNRLRLTAKSSFGNLRVNARVEGGRLAGHWGPGGLITGLFFRGELRGVRDPAYVRTPPIELYDRVWASIERSFYAPDYNGVDIRSLRERYRPQIAASRTDGELHAIIRRMLAEFKSSHLDFFAMPRIDPQPGATPADQNHGISWRQAAPSIGYLRIESFEDGPEVMARVDRAFSELAHNPSLIVDVRENGGGSLTTAMRLGDHIFAARRPVGYFAGREGLMRRGAASIDALDPASLPLFTGYSSADLAGKMQSAGAVMLATGGRAPAPYRGRLVILVDEYCFSACEALASVAKETGAATLVGRKTAGAMLAAFPVDVGGGWTLMLPVWDFRTPGGVRVEGRGVEPNVPVRKSSGDMAAALRLLRGR
jgi:C-terminal processing protease CtpA/Prc